MDQPDQLVQPVKLAHREQLDQQDFKEILEQLATQVQQEQPVQLVQ
jgi:hypothetical protein